MIELLTSDLEILKNLHKKEKIKHRTDRIKMILMLAKDFSRKEVSELLLIDEDMVSMWKNKFLNRTDNESWLDDNYIPYFGKLSTIEMSRICGYSKVFKVATKIELNHFINTNFLVDYTLSGVQKLLTRIGISHQQMHRLPGKVDIAKQAVFVERYEQEMAQMPENEGVMFIDAVHPQHNSTPSKIWSPARQPRWINSNTGRERLNINGAYNPITATLTEKESFDALKTADVLSKVATAMADGFISCWEVKYHYNYTRPETFINRFINKDWTPLIQTPPFPEYPSGHSVCSGSASAVLNQFFGNNYAYTDNTEAPFGMPERSFKSFDEAAAEAFISRLYGGIHFKAALVKGLEQGKKVGENIVNKLK